MIRFRFKTVAGRFGRNKNKIIEYQNLTGRIKLNSQIAFYETNEPKGTHIDTFDRCTHI